MSKRVLKISLEGTVGCRGHGSNHSRALSTCRIQITIINRINPVLWIRIHLIRIRNQHFKWIRIRIRFRIRIQGWKDVQTTGEAFNPQKRTTSTCKRWNLLTVFYISGSFLLSWIRVRSRSGSATLEKSMHSKNNQTITYVLVTVALKQGMVFFKGSFFH